MGLKCCVCGEPWRLDKPLMYHHNQLHCDTFACSRECGECKDWERAIEEGGVTHGGEDRKRGDSIGTPAAPVGESTKAEGYAAMMARLKGGAK